MKLHPMPKATTEIIFAFVLWAQIVFSGGYVGRVSFIFISICQNCYIRLYLKRVLTITRHITFIYMV